MFAEFGKNTPGKLYDQWPRTPEGEPVPPKFLTNCSNRDVEDEMLVNFLKSYGIPAVIEYPGDGAFGKLVLGTSGTGSSIFVPETMYEQAKELMEAEPDDDVQG